MILKKNTSKLNFPCIIQTLGRITTDREKSDNLLYLKDFLNPLQHVKRKYFLSTKYYFVLIENSLFICKIFK